MLRYLGIFLFVSIITVLILVCVLIKIENRSIVRILKRLGVDVYISNIPKYFKILKSLNRDVVGFINIKGVCQCPVLKGDYSKKSINRRYSNVGELYLLDSKIAKAFKSFSKDKENITGGLKDLTVIKGSLRNRNYTTMGANFSLMRQYVHTLKSNQSPTFEILELDKSRNFKILYGIDLLIEDMPSFSCRGRLELLDILKSKAYYKYTGKVDLEKDILVFMTSTDIDIHMVVVVEV